MMDLLGRLSALHRPRLLIRAARIGARDYRRDRHLPRLLGFGNLPKTPLAVLQLIELEQPMDQRRCDGDPGYSLTRHVELMIALMGEAQLLSNNRARNNRNGQQPLLETAQIKPVKCGHITNVEAT